MRAKFVGNGDADPPGVTFGGVWYPLGEWTDVPPEWEAKMAWNNHFETEGDVKPLPEDKAALVAMAQAMGIPADMRWSLARLRREIRAHGEEQG